MHKVFFLKKILTWYGAALVVILALLRGLMLASMVLTNIGMLALRDGLLTQPGLSGRDYPYYNVLSEEAMSVRAVPLLRQAAAIDDNSGARWALGRAALVLGEEHIAADALGPLSTYAEQDPLRYYVMLTAFSYGNQPEKVINLFESTPAPQHTQAISDVVALACLDIFANQQEKTRTESASLLERVRDLRPGDLYANRDLWQMAMEIGDAKAAAAYSETVTYFPLDAISPTDGRLLDYVAEAVMALQKDGLWSRETLLNVTSFLVWKHNDSVGVKNLLQQLVERYPDDPDWHFYQAELYHRRNDWIQADTYYHQTLTLDPGYAQAYLRLGMIAESKAYAMDSVSPDLLENAAREYFSYCHASPGDLLGLKKLTGICTKLEEMGLKSGYCDDTVFPEMSVILRTANPTASPAALLRETLARYTDNRYIVADLLNVPLHEIRLGPDLISNGSFETWVDDLRPQWWNISQMASGNPWNKGVFINSADNLIAWDGTAAQVNGLWLQANVDKQPGRSGYWQTDEFTHQLRQITLADDVPYVLSFFYSTNHTSDNAASVWVSYDARVLSGGDRWLPATHGNWWQVVIVGWNRSGHEVAIRPLLRSFASGQVWFDDIHLYAIHSLQTLHPEATRVVVLPLN